MAGAEDVVALLAGCRDGAEFSGLALNRAGATRLLTTTLPRMNIAVGASEQFSYLNAGTSVRNACAAAIEAIALARLSSVPSTATISVAFGCPYAGDIDPETVVDIAQRLTAGGADEIVLADTIGVATPRRVRRLVEFVCDATPPPTRIGVHMHDTRGVGLANVYSALEAGASLIDTATAGIGGCPFAPGAAGNLATEDVVYALERDGIDTGVDIDRLFALASWLERHIGITVASRTYKAGAWPAPDRSARALIPSIAQAVTT
jgi:isopropylmalate/homocitrate/citramalate synthase